MNNQDAHYKHKPDLNPEDPHYAQAVILSARRLNPDARQRMAIVFKVVYPYFKPAVGVSSFP